ncbi:MAG TPA: HlyD family secretion protein [Cellvibrio sp.]|nr:HlyD family secretion protein [Cellvibrio sp.]
MSESENTPATTAKHPALERFSQWDYRYKVGLVIALVVCGMGARSFATRDVQTTDNATVQCDIIDVVSEVRGVIETVKFKDDQPVGADDVVIKLESSQYAAEANKAKAALELETSNYTQASNQVSLTQIDIDKQLLSAKTEHDSAGAILTSTEASIEQAIQELESTKADLNYLKDNYENVSKLFKQQMTSRNEYTNAKRLYESKEAMRASLVSKIEQQRSLRKSQESKVEDAGKTLSALQESQQKLLENIQAKANAAKAAMSVAQAEYDLAKINLERTEIKAKRAGYISNRRTSSGDYVEIGQPIASIVSCQQEPWIQANFKETQITRMKEGQKVEFTIDTYPDVTFEGVVESISSGSGAIFSVLPPENASGNFTKVVKRMPVKIQVANTHDAIFRIGASANVTVYTN